jgi:hypothetical protein
MGLFVQHGHERLQIVTDVHRDFGARKHAPHRTRQPLVADFRNPAPSAVVHRDRQARLEHRARFFGKAASRKIDVAEVGVREARARRE